MIPKMIEVKMTRKYEDGELGIPTHELTLSMSAEVDLCESLEDVTNKLVNVTQAMMDNQLGTIKLAALNRRYLRRLIDKLREAKFEAGKPTNDAIAVQRKIEAYLRDNDHSVVMFDSRKYANIDNLAAEFESHEVSRLLSISPRTLWTITNRGDIACIRINRCVRYTMEDIEAYIKKQRKEVSSDRDEEE